MSEHVSKKAKTDAAVPLPPFVWPTTVAEVERDTQLCLDQAAACLDAVAAVPDAAVTFANVVSPMMHLPVYKTNTMVCQAKVMQHCSTIDEVRTAAAAAGGKFTEFRAAARRRKDVYAKVKTFQATPEAQGLQESQAWFLASVLGDFERGGLALDDAAQAAMQVRFLPARVLGPRADSRPRPYPQTLIAEERALVSEYQKILGEDKTEMEFAAEVRSPSWRCAVAWRRCVVSSPYRTHLPPLRTWKGARTTSSRPAPTPTARWC